jgi:excinuclease UvrABC nuclease subunit
VAVLWQGVFVSIVAAWNSLTSVQVASVPKQEGVYELANLSRSTIYIGRSDDLNRRIREHINDDDSCWRRAAYVRYEVTSRSEQRLGELLEEYYQQHQRYPPCN